MHWNTFLERAGFQGLIKFQAIWSFIGHLASLSVQTRGDFPQGEVVTVYAFASKTYLKLVPLSVILE